MKMLMRLCLPAVLGAATLFGAAVAADAPGSQDTRPSPTALAGGTAFAPANAFIDGPFATEQQASDDVLFRHSLGYQAEYYFQADSDGDSGWYVAFWL